MRKIVLILGGIVAKKFLQSVLEKYFSNHNYIVVSNDSGIVLDKIPSGFSFHAFDPTSSYRLLGVLDSEVSDVFIVLEDREEKRVVYDIVRESYKEMRIVIDVSDEQEAEYYRAHDKTLLIDESSLVANSIVSKLPNVPLIPQDFGLGLGEVMEINVPVGSVYAYRHVGSIHQKNYRIVGLYRQNKLLLADFSLVIQPADTLLVVGEPEVLTQIYHQVKSDIGQFPAPFGKDIYAYVDMVLQDFDELMRDVEQAIFLHNNLKNTHLYIKVLHPSDVEVMQQLKAYNGNGVSVVFDYERRDFAACFRGDVDSKIGMVVLGKELFASRSVRKLLFASGVPVFKTSYKAIESIKNSLVVLNSAMSKGENISSVIFDISIQIGLDIRVYDFEPDGHYQDAIAQDYQGLARNFDKKIKLIQTPSKNPILYLREHQEPLLQFLPFERCITGRRFLNFLSTSIERNSFLLEEHPQIFIPILEQLDDR